MPAPATPAGVFARRHADLAAVITHLRGDAALPRTFEGSSYTASDLPALYRLLELLGVKAAIEAITAGAQSYEIEGLVYTRATLFQLQAREKALEEKAARRSRGGINLRFGVPY